MTLAEFVDRLRLIRLERRMKSTFLAGVLGVRIQTFSSWECHGKSPNEVNLTAWAEALGVPVPDGIVARPRVAHCGTLSGKRRHQRLGEPVCAPCKKASNDYQAAWRASRRSS